MPSESEMAVALHISGSYLWIILYTSISQTAHTPRAPLQQFINEYHRVGPGKVVAWLIRSVPEKRDVFSCP